MSIKELWGLSSPLVATGASALLYKYKRADLSLMLSLMSCNITTTTMPNCNSQTNSFWILRILVMHSALLRRGSFQYSINLAFKIFFGISLRQLGTSELDSRKQILWSFCNN